MEIKPRTDGILMSEILRGQVPQLEDDLPVSTDDMFVTVVAMKHVAGKDPIAIVGSLKSVVFEVAPAIEFKVSLEDAFDVVEGQELWFSSIELHLASRIVTMGGPFAVTAAGVRLEVPADGMCILSLSLARIKKS